MPRPEETPIERNEQGDETHPSFGVIQVSRVTGGTNLFDSSIPHSSYITLRVLPATRKRDLHTDWIHPVQRVIVEVDMSFAQWASVVSNMNSGSGTPVTINRREGKAVPRASNDEQRLAVTAREVSNAAATSTADISHAVQAVLDAFEQKAGRREMAAALNTLRHTTANVPANMKFAADRLTKHAEDVVTKSKADIEAMHLRAAHDASRQLQPEQRANELTEGQQ